MECPSKARDIMGILVVRAKQGRYPLLFEKIKSLSPKPDVPLEHSNSCPGFA